MKQGWLMMTAVAGLGLLAGCGKPASDTAVPDQAGPELVIQSEEQFLRQVEQAPGVVLVDFWATWCPPCKYMNPILREFAQANQGRLTVAKVDVDDHQGLANRFKVQAIPTLVLFKDGQPVDVRTGAMPKEELATWVEAQLAPAGG